MAKTIKIEPRTISFLSHYNRLRTQEGFPKDSELLSVMGIKSASTLSEIKGKRQNIQPEAWERFKKHFNISEKSEQEKTQSEDQAELLEVTRKYNKLLEERSEMLSKIELLEKDGLVQNAKIYALEEFLLQLAAEVRRPDQRLAVQKSDIDSQSVILGKLEGAALRRSLGKSTAASGNAGKKGIVPDKVKAG